jgi:adenylate kinase
MRIVFIGPPGSGKGTQAQQLKEHLGIMHLSTGEVLRDVQRDGSDLGRQAAQYMAAGKLVPDEMVLNIVVERIAQPDCVAGCLFDGFPRTVAQAKALDEMLAERGTPLDLVLSLELPEEKLKGRLLRRGRGDDNQATIDERFRHYYDLTEPVLDYYQSRGRLCSIDGDGTAEEVFARIRAVVDAANGSHRS